MERVEGRFPSKSLPNRPLRTGPDLRFYWSGCRDLNSRCTFYCTLGLISAGCPMRPRMYVQIHALNGWTSMAWKRSRVQFPLAPRDAAGQRPAALSFSVLAPSGSNAGSNDTFLLLPMRIRKSTKQLFNWSYWHLEEPYETMWRSMTRRGSGVQVPHGPPR